MQANKYRKALRHRHASAARALKLMGDLAYQQQQHLAIRGMCIIVAEAA